MSKLKGKVAIVTGSSKGIGAGIAKALAAEGASVVVNYASSKEGADAVVASIIKTGGKAVAVGGNVSKAADAQSIVDTAITNYGRLDILVNNSGVYEFAPLAAITEEHFHRCFASDINGVEYRGRGCHRDFDLPSTLVSEGVSAWQRWCCGYASNHTLLLDFDARVGAKPRRLSLAVGVTRTVPIERRGIARGGSMVLW